MRWCQVQGYFVDVFKMISTSWPTWDTGNLLQMEQHNGNMYFSLEGLVYFSQNLRVEYTISPLAIDTCHDVTWHRGWD